MKKIISIILIVLMIIGIVLIPTKSEATFTMNEAYLYSKGLYKNYLHWGPIGIVFNYVVYEKDGQEYPAYCLNKDLDGVSENLSYWVNTEQLLTDVNIWRTIINGYPYKTYKELGCETKEEAFLATKQAVYCTIYDRNPEEYIANSETAERVRNALIQIVTNARKSTEVKLSADLTIHDITNNWVQDEINNKYVSKVFAVKANSTIKTYSVELQEINIDGVKIVDENNIEKTNFNYGENFKIIMPITNMKNEGNFNIKVNGKVLTKPILYAYSTDKNLQDYALTGVLYEDGSGLKKINYTKNETKVILLKQDENSTPLQGVKFNLLNKNKEIVYTDLITNEEGKIIIENLEPGTYYVEETKTLNGYTLYEEQIEAQVDYNEELTIKVTNTRETTTIEKPETTQKEQEIVIKLPKTGM